MLNDRADKLFKNYPKEVLAKFKKFHADNPHIYEAFKDLAFKMKATGRKKYSAEIIVNVLRWERDLSTTGEPFKINNDFKPIYARLLIFNHPELESFFELREPISKGLQSIEEKRRMTGENDDRKRQYDSGWQNTNRA